MKQTITLLTILLNLIVSFPLYGKDTTKNNGDEKIIQMLKSRYSSNYNYVFIQYEERSDCYTVFVSPGHTNGLCDNNGIEIIPPKYDVIYDYTLRDHDYCKVKKNDLSGIYSISKNKEIVPTIFDKIDFDYSSESKTNPIFYVTKSNKKGVYNSEIGEIVPPVYDNVTKYNPQQIIFNVTLNGKSTFFDINSRKELTPFKYDRVILTNREDIVIYLKDGKYGLFSVNRQIELTNAKYDYIDSRIKNNCIEYKNNDTYGLLNDAGEELIPAEYSRINIICDSIVLVIKDREYDKNHNIVKNGKWGAYNLNRKKMIAPPKYDDISNIISEKIIFCNIGGKATENGYFSGGVWGGIDTDGNTVIPFEYESISPFKNGVAQVKINGAVGLLENPLTGTSLTTGTTVTSPIDTNIPNTNKINDETFAIIIANEDYPLIDASYSKRDGATMAKYCESRLGIPKSNIMVYNDATFGKMQSVLSHCSDIAEVYDGNASFIFYFAGIGDVEPAENQTYLLPIDYSSSNVALTSVNVRELISEFNNMNLDKFIIITDCPFNGVDRTAKPITEERGVTLKQNSSVGNGNFLWISSSHSSNKGTVDKKQGHGILTYSLLELLQQNRKLNLGDLIEKLDNAVKRKTLETNNEVSAPVIINNLDKNTIL